MPVFGPISHRELVRGLRALGWNGPTRAGKHPVMTQGPQQIVLPNPHAGSINTGLLSRILRQAGITREEWEQS